MQDLLVDGQMDGTLSEEPDLSRFTLTVINYDKLKKSKTNRKTKDKWTIKLITQVKQ